MGRLYKLFPHSVTENTNGQRECQLRRKIRVWLSVFIVGLLVSGLTAFPLQREVDSMSRSLGLSADLPTNYDGVRHWILYVREGLHETYAKYPFMAYGTDWLAFSHIIIALFFVGPLIRPIGNRWVIGTGLLACGLAILLALTCGPIRGIPFFWQLIDCSFGVCGALPLWLVWRDLGELEKTVAFNPSSNV